MDVMSTPHWFEGADGRAHLVYELALTNGFPIPVTVTSVSVHPAGGGRAIGRLTGDALTGSMSLMESPTQPTTTVPGSSIGVVWFDLSLPGRRSIPRAIEHRLTVSVPPGFPVPQTITSTGGRARVDRRPPVVLGPPLHFQVMDRPSALDSDGLPYVFDGFRLAGRTPPLDDAFVELVNSGAALPIDPAGRGPRHDELPLGRDVVDFPSR